jgi:hypothetical protein
MNVMMVSYLPSCVPPAQFSVDGAIGFNTARMCGCVGQLCS